MKRGRRKHFSHKTQLRNIKRVPGNKLKAHTTHVTSLKFQMDRSKLALICQIFHCSFVEFCSKKKKKKERKKDRKIFVRMSEVIPTLIPCNRIDYTFRYPIIAFPSNLFKVTLACANQFEATNMAIFVSLSAWQEGIAKMSNNIEVGSPKLSHSCGGC